MVKLWHSLNKWEIGRDRTNGGTMAKPEQWLSYGTAEQWLRYVTA